MRYRWRISVCSVLVVLSGLSSDRAPAQEQDAADADVMRPTRLGLRLTPSLARAFGRIYVADEVATLTDVTDEQVAKLSESIARRSRELVSDGGTDLRDACEGCLAMLIENDGHFNAETSRVFAERMQPILPVLRSFVDGVAEDGRRVLTPEQYAELDRKLRRDSHDLTRLENKMRRWAEGGFKEGEPPQLDRFEPEDGPPFEDEPEDQPRRMRRQVRRTAENQVNRIGPDEWIRFLARAKTAFEFDDEQVAKADAILAEYREKAEAVMTPEWRARMLENRMRRRAYDFVRDQPVEPLRWRLNKEYEDATKPIDELGRAFRDAILALVTDTQRQTLLAKIEETATRHGWALDRGDTEILGLAP